MVIKMTTDCTGNDVRSVIANVFSAAGYASYLNGSALEMLEILYTRLVGTNRVMNITAITDPYGVALRHFADSVSAAPCIPEGASVIDVGCGGGFPSLPLAIVRPDLKITALDSTAKKLTFISSVSSELSLGVKTLAMRAEDAAQLPEYRGAFGAAVSRAVARLDILCELCIPFVRTGGVFIAMKGQTALAELDEARRGITKLGAAPRSPMLFTLSDAGERGIIICDKLTATPPAYPRAFAKIKKLPL